MSFFAWMVLGLIAEFIGSKIVNSRGEGIVLDILLGIAGALAGGWLFHIFGARGVSGLNLYSLFVAAIGSMVLLVLYHALRRRRASSAPPRLVSQLGSKKRRACLCLSD
jgi:uncharacterized membrane protein YeaQ/YmgE (transglycosylase-associated protein family)